MSGTESERGTDDVLEAGEETRHHRKWQAAGLALLVFGGTAIGWRQLHPAPLSVSAVLVTADLQAPSAAAELETFTVNLSVQIDSTEPDDSQFSLLGLVGPGLLASTRAATASAMISSAGHTLLTVEGTVNCAEWTGLGIVANFRVSRGTEEREFTAPVRWGRAASGLDGLPSVCGGYIALHPLQLVGFSAELDPVAPVVHTVWRLHNRSNRNEAIDQAAAESLEEYLPPQLPVSTRLGVDSVQVAAGADESVPVDVRIESCFSPTALLPASFEKIRLDLFIQDLASSDDHRVLVLPTDLMGAKLLPSVRAACLGAPTLANPIAIVSLSGTEFRLAGNWSFRAGWSDPRPFLASITAGALSNANRGHQFAGVPVKTAAPAPLLLRGIWQPHDCSDVLALGQAAQITLLLNGDRQYPYLIPLHVGAAAGVCKDALTN